MRNCGLCFLLLLLANACGTQMKELHSHLLGHETEGGGNADLLQESDFARSLYIHVLEKNFPYDPVLFSFSVLVQDEHVFAQNQLNSVKNLAKTDLVLCIIYLNAKEWRAMSVRAQEQFILKLIPKLKMGSL